MPFMGVPLRSARFIPFIPFIPFILAACSSAVAGDSTKALAPHWLSAPGDAAGARVFYLRHGFVLARAPRTAVLKTAVVGAASVWLGWSVPRAIR